MEVSKSCHKPISLMVENMSTSGLTLLLTVFFILFARVTSTLPPWEYSQYKFHCESICEQYLSGETFICHSASGSGLAAGSLIIRILPQFDWRYYKIYEAQASKDTCRHVWVADEYYSSQRTTAQCNPIGAWNNDIRTRSSGDKRTDAENLEKLVDHLSNIRNLTNALQSDVMVVDETPEGDERTKRALPDFGEIAKDILSLSDPINKKFNNASEGYNNKGTPRFAQYPAVNQYGSPYDWTPTYGDPQRLRQHFQSDSLCYWATKTMCYNRRILYCYGDVCCWATIFIDACNQMWNENDINNYRESIYHIIRNTR